MSPLWIKHELLLTGEELALASGVVLPRFRPLGRHSAQIDPLADSLPGIVKQLLSNAPRQLLPKPSVGLLLGEPHARYAVLPWQEGLYTANDWEAYARLVFAEQFRVEVGDWRIRVATNGYGSNALAVGMNRLLYDRLLDAVSASGYTLKGVAPLLIGALNQFSFTLLPRNFGLLLLQQGYITALFVVDGNFHSAISQPRTAVASLVAAVNDLVLLAGAPLIRTIYLCSAGMPAPKVPSQRTYKFKWLGSIDRLMWPVTSGSDARQGGS